jgi:acetyl-CoA carboxylase biotin carboxyl carrier protein
MEDPVTAEWLDEILGLMLEHGLAHVSFSDGKDSVSMRLGTAPENHHAEEKLPVAGNAPETLSTVSMGRLAFAHPARPAESRTEGSSVAAGAAVAYVIAGAIITSVVADRPGVLGGRLRQEGDIVGYGTPVFEFTAHG